jgi:hypothetical protein
MTKVLYVMGADGGCDGRWREFRWSLRSLEMYARGADGEVNVVPVVVGAAPDWFTGDVMKVDDPCERKTRNMGAKVIAACKAGLVEGEFLFSADDHFLTRPRDFDTAPQYWKNAILRSREECKGKGNNFGVSLYLARETLLKHGYPAMDFSQHFNTFFHANDWRVAKDLMKYSLTLKDGNVGANFHSIFANMWLVRNKGKRPLVWRPDRKYPNDTPDLMEAGRTDRFAGFSINDGAFKVKGFEAWMNAKYSAKSRWEK